MHRLTLEFPGPIAACDTGRKQGSMAVESFTLIHRGFAGWHLMFMPFPRSLGDNT